MINNYNHLNYTNRILIKEYLSKNYSIRKISKEIKKSPSTISREIKRNYDCFNLEYNPEIADKKAMTRHKHKFYFWDRHIYEKYEDFTNQFVALYDGKKWMVENTYFYIKNNFNYPIPSLKTIFNWINSGKWAIQRKQLLRRYYKKGGKRANTNIIDRLVGAKYVKPIWTRPQEINDRSEFGHWELDLICGRNVRGAYHIITFVERKTRFCYTAMIKGKHPDNLNRILSKLIGSNNIPVRSITTDNGFEFRKLGLLAYKFDICIYFADKYASWQKGSNENWNGLFRRYFPKGTNFDEIDPEYIKEVTLEINYKRRKILNWNSSLEYYKENLIETYNKIFE